MRALVLGFLLVAACSNGGGGSPGGSTGDYCAAKAARASRCDAGASSNDRCQQELLCFNTALRADIRDEVLNCITGRACGSGDDQCTETPAQRFAGDSDVSSFVTACKSKRSTCANSFGDDHCSVTYAIVTNDLRSKMKACLDGACGGVSSCFNAAYASVGCD